MSKAEGKVLLTVSVIVSLAVLPLTAYAQDSYSVNPAPNASYTGQQYPGAPPVEQPLVSEGVFAVELAKALNGEVQDETQAENWLSSMGIEPSNGWVGDYPMTPDIVAEIENSAAAAAEANQLQMGSEEAQRTVGDVLANMGLAIQAGSPEGVAGQSESPPPEVVNNYYTEYGPPAVTYYAPPPNYTYLYAWVPYPFWFGGFFFDGFFVLHDFHRHVHFRDRDFVVSNHFFNPRTHSVIVVDPRRRFENHVAFDSRRDFHSREFEHSPGMMAAHNRPFTPHSAAPEFRGGFHEGGEFHERAGHSGGFHGGGHR